MRTHINLSEYKKRKEIYNNVLTSINDNLDTSMSVTRTSVIAVLFDGDDIGRFNALFQAMETSGLSTNMIEQALSKDTNQLKTVADLATYIESKTM